MDIARLGIEVNSSQVERATGALGRIVPAAGAAEQATERLSRASRAAAAAQNLQNQAAASLTSQLRAYAAALGPLAVTGLFLKNTIDAANAQAQLEASLVSTGHAAGLTATELTALAGRLQSLTTFEDDAIIRAESLLLTFKNIGRDVFPTAAEAILDVATKMSGDLQSATVQLGKALNDPITGLTSLTRVGIGFTEAQKAMIGALVEAGDMAGAQRIILAELESQMGGSAEAARNTLGGALTALQNSFGNLFEVSRGGSENLRLSIESLIDVLDSPSTQLAIQNFGGWLFDGFAGAFAQLRNLAAAWDAFKRGNYKDALVLANGGADGWLFDSRDMGEAMLRQGMFSNDNFDLGGFYDAVKGGGADQTKVALDNRLAAETEYAAASVAIAEDHATKLAALADNTAATWIEAEHAKLSATLSAGSTIIDSLETLFGESKALSIAQAVINTAEGVTKALAQGGFLGFAQAAAVGAAGAAQIATIMRTNPGGSGSLPAVTGGASAASVAQTPTASQAVTINLTGSTYSDEQIRELVASLNGAARDGVRLESIIVKKVA